MKITGVDYEGGELVAVYINSACGDQKFFVAHRPSKMELAEIISKNSLYYNTPGQAACLAGNLIECGVLIKGGDNNGNTR